ncbi:MAG TPA: hypothetical protein VLS28_03450 [Candidatus Sulfomarinibacteraceae bacterium]|nr:hypothetical protein [Candidatus Sulfomarinibacteraceae bacterium]
METAQVVALVAFLLVAAGVTFGVRRTGSILSRTREAESFRGEVHDLVRRAELSLSEIAILIDGVRRRAAEPETIGASLSAARDAADRYADEARTLSAPPMAVVHRDAIVHELERAGRALELVEHGCSLLGSGRRFERGPEADTAVKRGYLNLIHAREAMAEHALRAIERAEDASPVRRIRRRPSSPP